MNIAALWEALVADHPGAILLAIAVLAVAGYLLRKPAPVAGGHEAPPPGSGSSPSYSGPQPSGRPPARRHSAFHILGLKKRPARRPSLYPLDEVICELGGVKYSLDQMTLNFFATGATGSGKTSTIAPLVLECIRRGFGAVIHAVKADECRIWSGRLADRIPEAVPRIKLIGPGRGNNLNVLDYVLKKSGGSIEAGRGMVDMLSNLGKMRTGGGHGGAAGDQGSDFFDKSAGDNVRAGLAICVAAWDNPSLSDLARVLDGAPLTTALLHPRQGEEEQAARWRENSWYCVALQLAKQRDLTPHQRHNLQQALVQFEKQAQLDTRTSTSIRATVNTLFAPYLMEPLHTLVAAETTTITPDTLWEDGSIILHESTVFEHGEDAVWAQALWRYAVQFGAQRRNIEVNDRPVVQLIDEYQEMAFRRIDAQWLAVSRGMRFINIAATQSVSALVTNFPKAEADTLLNNYRNKLIYSIDDPESMEFFSKLMGRERKVFFGGDAQANFDPTDIFGQNRPRLNFSQHMEPVLEPGAFAQLAKPTPEHPFAEVIIYRGGSPINGRAWVRTRLPQLF